MKRTLLVALALLLACGYSYAGLKLPSPQKRDQAIAKAGLQAGTSDWDELQKDLLYIRAHKDSLKHLEAKYPALDEKKLRRFLQIVKSDK